MPDLEWMKREAEAAAAKLFPAGDCNEHNPIHLARVFREVFPGVCDDLTDEELGNEILETRSEVLAWKAEREGNNAEG